MVIKPRIRGFICTTAHPAGCAERVRLDVETAESAGGIRGGPGLALVIGASSGYGLACRIQAAFACGAKTVGVSFERAPLGDRTGTAGFYNTAAFDRMSKGRGIAGASINGDAFLPETKAQAIQAVKSLGGKVDLVIYSLAAPRRTENGVTWNSVIKPVGSPFRGKSVDVQTGQVSEVEIAPATQSEIDATVKVMGGEDWLAWIRALDEEDVLAENCVSAAFSYIGPEKTHAIYKNGTIGKAKEHLQNCAREINALLTPMGGRAFVSVNKALVTQASSAIPVVPLYISLLYRVMKDAGLHEDCQAQAARLFGLLYGDRAAPTDAQGRIRLDDWEMRQDIQAEVERRWQTVTSENIARLADLQGYRDDFLRLFGFGLDGVDYDADV